MNVPDDLSIAQSTKLKTITEIAGQLDLDHNFLIPYGHYKAKIHIDALKQKKENPRGKLVLVSAITPTPAGEGKTTVSIGLAQGLKKIGKKSVLALREPSMGPLFGMKGGATGGGYSQILPMEDINLQFTGDFPAISAAHNLLAAALDNALFFRQFPELDHRQVLFPRVLDMNDRALREILIGLGGKKMGVPRETHFDITAASEIMAILALSNNYEELKARLGNILIGTTYDGEPVTASKLKVAGAMTAVLKDAIHPNLVQSIEGVPTFVHCGPFANIAHGSNSILATKMAMKYGDIAVTEAGFGFDLGAEKFFDITSPAGGFYPDLCVLVVTVRALRMHGGIKVKDLDTPAPLEVQCGLANMEKHIENIRKFNVPVLVALNRFASDSEEEIELVRSKCNELGAAMAVAEIHSKGGEGGIDLAEKACDLIQNFPVSRPTRLYENHWSVEQKIETIAEEIYGAEHIDFTPQGKIDLNKVIKLGYDKLPLCMAKTQKSLSDNPLLLGRPKDFIVTVRGFEIAAGAGFIVPLTGDILRMPGLPKKPAYEGIDIDSKGTITGLF